MAKSIFGLLLSNSTVENFRAWGSALSVQLGVHLTRVTQTGEINWVTVSAPSAANTSMGFEVYRFDDDLQATAPIFIRFDYGSGAITTSYQIRATVGKSVDGSGVIGGTLLPITTVIRGDTAATVVENCYISNGSGSSFSISLAPINSARGGFFAIERAVGVGGQPIAAALLISNQITAPNTQSHRFIDYHNATSETVSGGIVAIPLTLSTDRSIANGTTAPIFPAACISPSGVFWRPRVILGTARQNAGLGEVITGLIDGNSYLSLGAGSQGVDQRSGAFSATLIRWD